MKKKLIVLAFSLMMLFAFTITCSAASSPNGRTLPENGGNGNGDGGSGEDGQNNSSKSPKTGVDLADAFIVVISAAGIALVAKKEYSKC